MSNTNRIPFEQFVPVLPQDSRAVKLSREDFMQLDLWTLPRNLRVNLHDAPGFGHLYITRTSKGFRADWSCHNRHTQQVADYPTELIAHVLQLAAARTTTAGVHTAISHAKEVVSFWVPLTRDGESVLRPLGVALNDIWVRAFVLAQNLPDVLRRFEVARPH